MNFSAKNQSNHHAVDVPSAKVPAKNNEAVGNQYSPGWALLSRGANTVTTSGAVIQRDENDDEQGLDISVLPPSLNYQLGDFNLAANTSRAALGFNSGDARMMGGYQYGSDIYANLGTDALNARIGVNPQSGVGSLAFGGSHNGFRYSLGANTTGAASLSFGYGAPLLPMPQAFSDQVYGAYGAIPPLMGAIPGALGDPMGAYSANQEYINALGAFGGSAGALYNAQSEHGGMPFGAGLSLSIDPTTGLVISGGVQGSF